MTDATKPTPGVWKRDPLDKTCIVTDTLCVDDIICLSPEEGGFEESAKNWEANAALIIEAGMVYHETGRTPRQLAEQRDELLKALKELSHWFPPDSALHSVGYTADETNAASDSYEAANAIIAKVEAKP